MFQRLLAALILVACPAALGGNTRAEPLPATRAPVGLWLTENREGVIRIAPCGPDLCGSIVGQSVSGPGSPEQASRCNLMILTVAPAPDGRWVGHITNPEDHRVWNVQLWQDEQGQLHLRGYIAVPLLGQTQIWTRYAGGLAPGCRMM